MELWRSIGDRVAAVVLHRPEGDKDLDVGESLGRVGDMEIIAAPLLSLREDGWHQKRHWDD